MRLLHFSLMFIFIAGLNSSKEERDPSHISYTDSENDPASPSRDGSTSVTRLPDISGLWSVSVRQGGGYSGSGDNTRLYAVPQESTHNGQEKAGSVISDLTYTTPHSLTDSTLSFTEQDSSLSSAETQWPGRSVSALTTAINTYTSTDTYTLPEKVSRTAKIYVNVHDDADTPSVHADVLNTLESEVVQGGDITVTSSAHTVSGSHLTALRNRASVTELETSESHRFHEVTDRGDASVMSSSYAASEGRNHSSDTFRTDHFTRSRNSPDFSITDGSNSVSGLEVSEFNSVTYTSDRAARPSQYKEASRTNRLLRSTHINQNVSNHTPSSLFDDSGTTTDTPRASVSHRQTETSTLSDSQLDASEDVTSTKRKSTEYYSYTSYYNTSPNTDSTPKDSTPTDLTSTDSATTQAPHTIHGEHTTVHEHTTTQWMSDPNMQHSSSEVPPTQTTPSSPATPTTHDFTSTPASYSAYGLGQGDPISSTTLHTSFLTSVITRDPTTTLKGSSTAPYDTTESKSSTGTEGRTQSGDDNQITRTSDLNNLSQVTTLSPESRPTTITRHTLSTSRDDPVTPTTLNPAATSMSLLTSVSTHSLDPASTSTPLANQHTSQTSHLMTTTRRNETRVQNHLTTSRNTPIIRQPDTTTLQVSTNTRAQTLTPAITQTSTRRTLATRIVKDWSQKGRVFIMEDQPANISVETFQVLLQVILEENLPPYARLVEVEPFLQKVAGYQSQQVIWHSGPVLQSLVTFRTSEAVSWLARAESLLQEAGLKPLPTRGVFVSGVRVKNITVGGLHSDVCSWAFSCPSDFYCVSSEGNVTCRSLCHSEYCNNHGICVHPSGQHPLCRCPVGEDFWFMGQRCDLRMTRQRLAAVCFGVLAAIAALMGLLAFLAVQHFKKTLIQAKAEQTQSSYRRFNHFDELSARFWRRSWPGSDDSQDNIAFSHSDELLHMRALDRACCYHDDTLSIASTYPDSVTHLNTVYPHSSQYQWEMSTCSLADGVIDSGKASDLSVCSWPIEPIQWTPFPLLQQLRNTNTIKPSRPRSYCEGMELVGLEKSRTA